MPSNLEVKKYHKASEGDLRLALARVLAEENRAKNPILAMEARYGFGDRRADFVMLDEFSHAFEIKSDIDTLTRLDEQISEYVLTFDFVSVVTTELHLSKVRSIAPKKVGILVARDHELKRVRRAQQNKRLSKHHLVASISMETLSLSLPNRQRRVSRQELEAFCLKSRSLEELRQLFLVELHNRFGETSRQFLEETDSDIQEEDLLMLRRVTHLSL